MNKRSEEKFKEFWYRRNPVHEINQNGGEDMFWGTAEMVAIEYAEYISRQTNVQICPHHFDLKIKIGKLK